MFPVLKGMIEIVHACLDSLMSLFREKTMSCFLEVINQVFLSEKKRNIIYFDMRLMGYFARITGEIIENAPGMVVNGEFKSQKKKFNLAIRYAVHCGIKENRTVLRRIKQIIDCGRSTRY